MMAYSEKTKQNEQFHKAATMYVSSNFDFLSETKMVPLQK